MNKYEIKTKWLEELRSGNHKQIIGTLKGETIDGDVGYCCLGVLAEKVLGKNLKAEKILDKDQAEDFGSLYATEGPTEIYSNFRYSLLSDFIVQSCTEMNDEKDMSFGEIADWLEEKWSVE